MRCLEYRVWYSGGFNPSSALRLFTVSYFCRSLSSTGRHLGLLTVLMRAELGRVQTVRARSGDGSSVEAGTCAHGHFVLSRSIKPSISRKNGRLNSLVRTAPDKFENARSLHSVNLSNVLPPHYDGGKKATIVSLWFKENSVREITSSWFSKSFPQSRRCVISPVCRTFSWLIVWTAGESLL